jgi:peptidoglycan/xylan/chitin deacetylase (PgdA/CDA1 family)
MLDPERPWNGYAVAFTFSSDDARADNLEWAETFRVRGLRYTLFVVTTWLGRSGYLTPGDLRRLHAEGFEIGSHSLHHPRLTELGDAELEAEVRGSKEFLESLLGGAYRCRSFAYPYHAHDRRVMEAVARHYLAARDGGLSPEGHPDFSEGIARWDSVSLYEVPLLVTVGRLTGRNGHDQDRTRAVLREWLPGWKAQKAWVNVYAHRLSDCHTTHMGWILDELLRDGDVWIAPFGEVAAYYRQRRLGEALR